MTQLVHLVALNQPDVENERISAFVQPFNWNGVLATLRELRAGHVFPEDILGLGRDSSKVSTEREELLLRRMGRKGCLSLRDSLESAVAAL